jgi:apolipoprotein N-acyltransferase
MFTLVEIPIFKVKILFLIVTLIQIGIVLWVSIEFIIYEKIMTYSGIVAFYFYPIYLTTFAVLFVRFSRINEEFI